MTYTYSSYEEEKLEWVNHTHEVIIESERFLSAMKDVETGQRGYLLTKDRDYLEPYIFGLKNAKSTFKKLQSLTEDNPKQQERLLLIEQYQKLKFEELLATIKLTQENRFSDALTIVMQDNGKEYIECDKYT